MRIARTERNLNQAVSHLESRENNQLIKNEGQMAAVSPPFHPLAGSASLAAADTSSMPPEQLESSSQPSPPLSSPMPMPAAFPNSRTYHYVPRTRARLELGLGLGLEMRDGEGGTGTGSSDAITSSPASEHGNANGNAIDTNSLHSIAIEEPTSPTAPSYSTVESGTITTANNNNNTATAGISAEDYSDLPPEWAWIGWRIWCFIQAAGNVAMLIPTVIAIVREPTPICDSALFNYSLVQAVLRGLQILLSLALAGALPRMIRRYTFRVHRKVERIRIIFVTSVLIIFAQIVNVVVGIGLLFYAAPACRTSNPPSTILTTTNILCLVELCIFISPAVLVYILPCLSGLLLNLPTSFAGASPTQLRRVRSVVVESSQPTPANETPRPSQEGRACPICLDDMVAGQRVKELPCGHRYHKDCIERHFEERSECPYCRTRL